MLSSFWSRISSKARRMCSYSEVSWNDNCSQCNLSLSASASAFTRRWVSSSIEILSCACLASLSLNSSISVCRREFSLYEESYSRTYWSICMDMRLISSEKEEIIRSFSTIWSLRQWFWRSRSLTLSLRLPLANSSSRRWSLSTLFSSSASLNLSKSRTFYSSSFFMCHMSSLY